MNANHLTLTLMLLTGAGLFAQNSSEADFQATQVAPGITMLSGVGGFTGGNLGLLTGDDGVVLIDDSMPPFAEKMKAAIAKVTGKPVDFVINTHVHGDHTGGNAFMAKEGATIVAHDNIRKRLMENGEFDKKGLPVVTFNDAVTFHLNGQEAHVFHVQHAHTDGDAVIHFKNADVIHTGDVMFNGMFPFIDLNSGGSVDGYIAAQEKIIAMCGPNTKIIPGHGPLASKADLQTMVEVLKDGKKLVAAMVKAGKSEADVVAANPLKKYHDTYNWQFITTERMTKTLYADLKK